MKNTLTFVAFEDTQKESAEKKASSAKVQPTKLKFRKSLLPLIKMALNTVGQNPGEVLEMIEEQLYPKEINSVLSYVSFYCSAESKHGEQEKAYKEWLKLNNL